MLELYIWLLTYCCVGCCVEAIWKVWFFCNFFSQYVYYWDFSKMFIHVKCKLLCKHHFVTRLNFFILSWNDEREWLSWTFYYGICTKKSEEKNYILAYVLSTRVPRLEWQGTVATPRLYIDIMSMYMSIY